MLKFNESEGEMDMCQAIEEMISDARTEGRNETRIETAKMLLSLNKLTLEEISKTTQLTLEEVKHLEHTK
jgi:predicted transposase/invertase (TIGR01784 family)